MRTELGPIRGVFGMGMTWAAAWSAAGVVSRWVFGVETDAPLPLIFGVFGFIAGVVFSAVLTLTERRRRFDQLSLRRFAGWGATGGILLTALFARAGSLGWPDVLALAPTLIVASAACAAGSLAIARRATRRALPDGRANTGESERHDYENRKVLEGGIE